MATPTNVTYTVPSGYAARGGLSAAPSPAPSPSPSPPSPPIVGFGSGSAAGTFSNDVWTPGRDSNGVVNQASWDLVPFERWVQIAGTAIDTSLTDIILAATKGWTYGALAWSGVMDAWNSFAKDDAGSRVWLVAAGGHADSANNGIYRFDAFKMAWAVEKMPSNRSLWSTGYATLSHNEGSIPAGSPPGTAPVLYGTFTPCGESDKQWEIKNNAGTLSPINDWFYDEIYWDNPLVNPGISLVGNPTARHEYSGSFYKADTDELIIMCRRLWRYSCQQGQWTYKHMFTKQVDGAEVMAFYDDATGEGLFAGAADAIGASCTYDFTTNQWNNANWATFTQYTPAPVQHDRMVALVQVPIPDYGAAQPGWYWTLDLDTRVISTKAQLAFAGGLSPSDFLASYSGADVPGLAHIHRLNRYWMIAKMVGGQRWLQIDPTTTPWTMSPLTFANTSPPVNSKPRNKFVEFPGLNAALIFSFGEQPGYIYKFLPE